MAISSVSSNISSQISSIKQSAPPHVRGEKENDGDSDDVASSKINTTAQRSTQADRP